MTDERYVIVAAIDDGRGAELVLDAAVSSAGRVPDAELHIVHVVEPPLVGAFPMMELDQLVEEGRATLARATAHVSRTFRRHIESHLAVDVAAKAVVQVAAELEAELIVLGSHRHNWFQRLVLGSVSRAVVDRARCTVMIVRPADYSKTTALEAVKEEPPKAEGASR